MSKTSTEDAGAFLEDPVVRLALITLAGLVLALWIARAPTSFNGKLPLIGDYVPLKLNAVHFIIFGPLLTSLVAGALWFQAARPVQVHSDKLQSGDAGRDAIALLVVFALVVLVSAALSLQYFLTLAPAEMCPTRPHYDFLWTNVPGPTRITHCMSGTEEINMEAPYYFEPQILQSWGHVLWPVLTTCLLIGTWRHGVKLGPYKAQVLAFEVMGMEPLAQLFRRQRS
ncbi:hypothetical protein SAMN05216228_105211 [Rhizobium tibeticum]|uniref:Uncharacterized protein n=2 Tax=Rhizobium tibeticum TaxID=501024 RepID=A0A1H8W2U8_9HYPH|nr:hypothetical protein RTCCBAU85039_6277 [Rhizobium tibeticum]SEP21955.1 hypothetical protein SAMN05216228_105211 [Rhizobium tibeticum]